MSFDSEDGPSDPKELANGNQIISEIKNFPLEGLIITWANPNLIKTEIEAVGIQKPLYDFVTKHFPDLKVVAGHDLYVAHTNEGTLVEVGFVGGKDRVSIADSLKS